MCADDVPLIVIPFRRHVYCALLRWNERTWKVGLHLERIWKRSGTLNTAPAARQEFIWLERVINFTAMSIPTEPIGSVRRPPALIEAMQAFSAGFISPERYAEIAHSAIIDTIRCFEDTGSPVITDGEQTKPSFATYPIHGSHVETDMMPEP